MLSGPRRTIDRARTLRRVMTLPEVLLWRELRARPKGLKFRRQHPAGRYVLDFFCAEARIAIEVDGEAHGRGDRPKCDGDRDAWLAMQGVTTIRIAATDILRNIEPIVGYIIITAEARLPLHQPAAGPPPRPGEVC